MCENELPWRFYGFCETLIFTIKIKHLVSMSSLSYLKRVIGFSYPQLKLNLGFDLKEHRGMWERKFVLHLEFMMNTVLDHRELDTIWKE